VNVEEGCFQFRPEIQGLVRDEVERAEDALSRFKSRACPTDTIVIRTPHSNQHAESKMPLTYLELQLTSKLGVLWPVGGTFVDGRSKHSERFVLKLTRM